MTLLSVAAAAGAAFLSVGLTGILTLLTHVLLGALSAMIAGVCTAAAVVGLWFALPLRRRAQSGGSRSGGEGSVSGA